MNVFTFSKNLGFKDGVFVSEIINTEPFSKMVVSWNADTPADTYITVKAQVFVDGKWSDWISWGRWSTYERASVKDDPETKLAGIWTDTLYVKDGKMAHAFRLMASLNNSAGTNIVPVLKSVSATIDLKGGAKREYPEHANISDIMNVNKEIDVPAFSQMTRDPKIAGSICNPTSAACVIDYYLKKKGESAIFPEQSAAAIYDRVYEGFGNWCFAAAFIGSFGLNSRVEFCESLYDLKREIYKGRPVIVSINKARSAENDKASEADFVVIHGFPISSTRGHIITVTGFTKIGGDEYVCVNDSAAASDGEAKRKYIAEEFDAAWANSGRIAYIIWE